MASLPLLVVLTGPSGAGKDSVLAALRQLPERPYAFAVNVTTRSRRPGERDGLDYHFISRDEFARLVREDQLLEHATVYGQDKGVLKAPVRDLLAAGHDVLLRTDVQGARYIKSIVPEAVTIFVAPPSEEELATRLTSRGGDPPEQVRVRLETAREEAAAAGEFDHTVVNDDLARAVAEVEAILISERNRPGRKPTAIP